MSSLRNAASVCNEHRLHLAVGASVICSIGITLFQRWNDVRVLLPRRRFIANAKCRRFLALFEDSALREAQRMSASQLASGSEDWDNLSNIENGRLLLLMRAAAGYDVDNDLAFRVWQVARVYVAMCTRVSLVRPANLPANYLSPLEVISRGFDKVMMLLAALPPHPPCTKFFDERAANDKTVAVVFADAQTQYRAFQRQTRAWAWKTLVDKNRGRIGNFWRSKRRHAAFCSYVAATVLATFYDELIGSVFFNNRMGVPADDVKDSGLLQHLGENKVLQAGLIVISALLGPIKAYCNSKGRQLLRYEIMYEMTLRCAAADTALIDSCGGIHQLTSECRRCADAADAIMAQWVTGAKVAAWAALGTLAAGQGNLPLFAFGTFTAFVNIQWIESLSFWGALRGVPRGLRDLSANDVRQLQQAADEAMLPVSPPLRGLQLLSDAAASKIDTSAPVALGLLIGGSMGDLDDLLCLDVPAIARFVRFAASRATLRSVQNHLRFIADHMMKTWGEGHHAGSTIRGLANAPDLNRVATRHLDSEEREILRVASDILPRRDFSELLASTWTFEVLRNMGIEAPTMYMALLNQRDIDRRGLLKDIVDDLKDRPLLITIMEELLQYFNFLTVHLITSRLLSSAPVQRRTSSSAELHSAIASNMGWWSIYEAAATVWPRDVFRLQRREFHSHGEKRLWVYRYLLNSIPATIDDCFSPKIDDQQVVQYRDLQSRELRSAVVADLLRPFTRDRKGRIVKYKLQHEVEFLDVSFAYPSTVSIAALDKCSFCIKARGFTGILGPSGGGKSTIFKLLARLYDPLAPLTADGGTGNAGVILIDGIPNYLFSSRCLRAMFTLVEQQARIDCKVASIAQAIAFNAPVTHAEVVVACKKARCHDFIMKKSNQYDTRGPDAKFSGGEEQRLAIARALVRKPEALLLDECTSAQDAATEGDIQAALNEIAKEHAVIVIAHRLSTLKAADNLLVIKDGKCVQQGTHEELIASNDPDNIYKRYLQEQSLGTHKSKRTRARGSHRGGSAKAESTDGENCVGNADALQPQEAAAEVSTAQLMRKLCGSCDDLAATSTGADTFYVETLKYHCEQALGLCNGGR